MPPPPTPFVVLAASRTGSTWVMDTLGSHPLVTPYYELFDGRRHRHAIWAGAPVPKWVEYRDEHPPAPARSRLATRWERARAVFRYLDEIFATGAPAGATGFKLMYLHLKSHRSTALYVRRRRVKIVHLVRWNHLDAVISYATADARGQFHAMEPPSGVVRARLDTDWLLGELRRREREVRAMRLVVAALRCPAIEVAYEDLVADGTQFRDVVQFLLPDAEPAPLASRLHKLNRESHRELVENYDEVEAALAGTRYLALLRGTG